MQYPAPQRKVTLKSEKANFIGFISQQRDKTCDRYLSCCKNTRNGYGVNSYSEKLVVAIWTVLRSIHVNCLDPDRNACRRISLAGVFSFLAIAFSCGPFTELVAREKSTVQRRKLRQNGRSLRNMPNICTSCGQSESTLGSVALICFRDHSHAELDISWPHRPPHPICSTSFARVNC